MMDSDGVILDRHVGEGSSSLDLVHIEYVNSVYIVHSVKDFDQIKSRHRIIPEPIGTRPDGPGDSTNCGPPYLLLPEQAMLLKEYVRLRQKLPVHSWAADVNLNVNPADSGSPSSNEKRIELATRIAKGRKAKAAKRDKQDLNAVERRVRKTDLEDVEVTREEIDAVVSELSAVERSCLKKSPLISIPQYDPAAEAYEDIAFENTDNSIGLRLKYTVFRDLWRRGFYMTDGLRFGCDYLLYESTPGDEHAKYLVKCTSTMSAICPLDLAALSRVASQVKKNILLAIVAPDSFTPYYIAMSWWRS